MKRTHRPWLAPRSGGYSAVEQDDIAAALIGGDEYTKGVEYRRGILGWFGIKRRPATRPAPKRGGYSGRMDIGELGPPDQTPSGYVPPPGRAAASPRPCCCHCRHGA